MKRKGRLQFYNVNGVWVDSAMEGRLDLYVEAWLRRQLVSDYLYCWLEDGVAVYLPASR